MRDRSIQIGPSTNQAVIAEQASGPIGPCLRGVRGELFRAKRRVRRGSSMFAFDYSGQAQELPLGKNTKILLGSRYNKPYDVTDWKQ